MRLRVSHYPNNEIRVTLTGEQSRSGTKELSGDETNETHPVFSCDRALSHELAQSPLLDIGSDFQESPKPLKSGFGGLPRKTVFGLNAKRTIQRVGGVCDRLYKHEEFVFLTGTLPGSTPESLRAIAEWSGYLVESLKNWVAYYVEERIDFYVWEWQGRGALHLHYAVHVPDPDQRKLVLLRFRQQWVRLLETVSERSGVDVFARKDGGSWRGLSEYVQAYAQTVRKSVAAYLAKYCSKGHKTSEAHYYPSRWWGCSRALLHKLEEMSVSYEITSLTMRKALAIYEELLSLNDFLTLRCYEYRHGSGTGKSSVGFHHPTIPMEEIRLCILTKLTELSRGFSAVVKKKVSSQGSKQETLFWQCLLPLLLPSASEPLRAKLQERLSSPQKTTEFSISDWRELYSIACMNCNHISLGLMFKRLKNEALREVRMSDMRGRYVSEESGWYLTGIPEQTTR